MVNRSQAGRVVAGTNGHEAAPHAGAAFRRTYRVEIRGGSTITRGQLDLSVPNVASAEGIVSAWLAATDPGAYVNSVYELAGGPVVITEPACGTPALHHASRCACSGIVWSDTPAAERAAREVPNLAAELRATLAGVRDQAALIGARVRSIHDDAPCPTWGTVTGPTTSPEWVMVVWDGPDREPGTVPVSVPFDELTGGPQ